MHTGNPGRRTRDGRTMTCAEKRPVGPRGGNMLHHRFPNGFAELLMDDTDREVCTLTDRAFRSLCVGDDAVYNDEFSYGFSPFNCHKPLVGEPRKKTKECRKQRLSHDGGRDAQPWNQQQHGLTTAASFLKALSATENSRDGIFKNGNQKDVNGQSWDTSALLSIQKELSEFSAGCHNTLGDGHFGLNQHHGNLPGEGSARKAGKDASKVKNGKSTIKLRKLNIKNFFLHSEFSPFQMWRDINRFPFGRQETDAPFPSDHTPKWYDSPLYRELAEAHRMDILNADDSQPCLKAVAKEPSPSTEGAVPRQRAGVEPPPPPATKLHPPPPPPKVPPKPTVTLAEMRCSSVGSEGNAAPWRQNKSRSRNALPVNPVNVFSPAQGRSSKTIGESVIQVKQEAKCFEVQAVEEVSSMPSTPFSICQLMTPLIPSRQPTETSEILQLCVDLPLRPDSEAKLNPEMAVKRESYKSLASSILFNLKDNRKRVKSRYSPPKFRTSEMPDGGTQSPGKDNSGQAEVGSDGCTSGLTTPAIIQEGEPFGSPVSKQVDTPSEVLEKHDFCSPSASDYLITNLLQTKRERILDEENHLAPIMQMKNNRSPRASKQNYPSLNLYKKTIPADSGTGQLQVPMSAQSVSPNNKPIIQMKESLPDATNSQTLPKGDSVYVAISPHVVQRRSPKLATAANIPSPHTQKKEGLAYKPNPPENTSRSETQSKDLFIAVNIKDTISQPPSTKDVIKAARDAINAEKHKAMSAGQLGPIKNIGSEPQRNLSKRNSEIPKEVETKDRSIIDPNHHCPKSPADGSQDVVSQDNNLKKDPPPVPKRTFSKSDILPSLEELSRLPSPTEEALMERVLGTAKNDYMPTNVGEPVRADGRLQHIFSARQNNYIKSQRYVEMEKEQEEVHNEGTTNARVGLGKNKELMKDSVHIMNDLQALKELEKARRSDPLDKATDKHGAIDIDAEAKTKNDLISRELRNLKKGMLSMRGNTQAKRDMFTKKDQDSFTKRDTKVILNKALTNDNYDRAKMALEEVISERQKYKSTKEKDADSFLAENTGTELGFTPRQAQGHMVLQSHMLDAKENPNGPMLAQRDMEIRERLGDLRDHNHIKHILSQNETRLSEMQQLGAKFPLPGTNTVTGDLKKQPDNNSKDVHKGIEKLNDERLMPDEQLKNNLAIHKVSAENGNHLFKENKENTKGNDIPPVPPRSKKGVVRKDQINIKESESCMEQSQGNFSIIDGPEDKMPSIKEVIKEDNIDPGRDGQNCDILTEKLGENNEITKSINPTLSECILSSELQTKHKCVVSPREERRKEMITYSKESPGSLESPRRVKRRAPLRPEDVNPAEHSNQESIVMTEITGTSNPTAAAADRITRSEMIPDQEAAIDISRNIVSPLLLVNGYNVNQSPPDQGSLSSKSSYFSTDSALHKHAEVYHSLDNLTTELEENYGVPLQVLGNLNTASASTGTEHVSVWDREPSLKSPAENEETERGLGRHGGGGFGDGAVDSLIGQQTKGKIINSTPMSPASTLSSPSSEIPALFVVKDNTFSHKPVKPIHLWLPKEPLTSPELGPFNHIAKNLPLSSNTAIPSGNSLMVTSSTPEKVSMQKSPLNSLSPSNADIIVRKSQFGPTLTVPQEEDRSSGVSPLSDGVESLATSAADTGDDLMSGHSGEVCKLPSERSGSPSSASGSQSGPCRPPPVLPKSEKALMKAMKLTTRRIKKEEGQKKPSHKVASSSRKHRVVKDSPDNPENKQNEDKHSTNSKKHPEKLSKGINEEHRHRSEERNHPNRSRSHPKPTDPNPEEPPQRGQRTNPNPEEPPQRGQRTNPNPEEPPQRGQRTDRLDLGHVGRSGHKTGKQERTESNGRRVDTLPDVVLTEREGRSSDRRHHPRDKPEHRDYSSDRVISNVPVYRAHVSERPAADRQVKRSQSMDRYVGDHAERRASGDMPEKAESRNQRIEKSIMDELQQRGRAKDRAGRGGDVTAKRSHSIDAYAGEASHPASLSRRSSYNGPPLSRQSSVEHSVVAQSIPMTQRKLLQDPDSGQYFFVDMPVQVKTKTFYDPETGNYVQLPVQPPEGTIPQASAVEVLSTPMVVYHGFVPVPMPSIGHRSVVQASQMEPGECDRRQKERTQQVYSHEGRPYLEPVYGPHDHLLGEFFGVEELDCAS